jgi:hypothetical protein
LLAVSTFAASTSAADRAEVVLSFQRQAALVSLCPGEEIFRGMVAARLGYVPFVDRAPVSLAVTLKPSPQGIVGRLQLVDPARATPGERTLEVGETECDELAASLAFAAAVAVDPEAVQREAGREPGEPVAQPAPPAPSRDPVAAVKRAPAAPTPKPVHPLAMRISLGGVVAGGLLPGVSGGPRLGIALDGESWSLGAEGSYFAPRTVSEPFGSASLFAVQGALIPCFRPALTPAWTLDACAVAAVGAMPSEGRDVTRPEAATDWLVTAGPRLGLTVMPWAAVGFAASVEMPVAITRVRLFIDDAGVERELWAQSPLGVIGGLFVVLRPIP